MRASHAHAIASPPASVLALAAAWHGATAASASQRVRLRPCPTTKRWGPALAEYYGYKFEFDHDKSPYYYLRRTDNATAEA